MQSTSIINNTEAVSLSRWIIRQVLVISLALSEALNGLQLSFAVCGGVRGVRGGRANKPRVTLFPSLQAFVQLVSILAALLWNYLVAIVRIKNFFIQYSRPFLKKKRLRFIFKNIYKFKSWHVGQNVCHTTTYNNLTVLSTKLAVFLKTINIG